MKQLHEQENETVDLEPINLGLPVLRELGAKWLVEMAEYFEADPQIIVNGFIRAGIAAALDQASGMKGTTETDPESESDFYVSEEEENNDVMEIGDNWYYCFFCYVIILIIMLIIIIIMLFIYCCYTITKSCSSISSLALRYLLVSP